MSVVCWMSVDDHYWFQQRFTALHRPDRSRWRPCIKGHVGQCRGQAVLRTKNWARVDFLQWVGPPFSVETWHRHWTKERMAKDPNPC